MKDITFPTICKVLCVLILFALAVGASVQAQAITPGRPDLALAAFTTISQPLSNIKDTYPVIATDPAGVPQVAWQGLYSSAGAPDGVEEDIYFSEKQGASFTQPISITVTSDYYSTDVSLAVDASGYAHVAFRRGTRETTSSFEDDIFYATNKTGVFSTTLVVDGQNCGHAAYCISPADPLIAVDGSGVVHLVFQSYGNIYYTNNSGGAFATPVLVPGMELTAFLPNYEMDVDGSGKVHIACRCDSSDGFGDILYANNVSGSWSEPVNLSASGVERQVALALDGAAKAHIIYSRNASPNLCYATNQSGSFGASTCFNGGNAMNNPNIDLDGDGKVHIAYLDNDDLYYANNFTGSFTFMLLADLSSLPSDTGVGRRWFTVSSDDRLHAVFHAGTSGNAASYEVYYMTMPLSAPTGFNKLDPANGATGATTNPTLMWASSSDASAYEYCYDTTDDDACTGWINNGTAISKTLSGLDTNTTFYWQVRAVNPFGTVYANGSETAFWSFKTGGPPNNFSKLTPANEGVGWTGDTDQGEPVSFQVSSNGLSWSNFRLKVHFSIGGCSGTDETTFPGPGTIINGQFSANSSTLDFTAQIDSSTNAHGTYRYDVTTICGNTTLNGTWTATFPPRQSTSPTLTWEAAAGAASYEYCYDTTDDDACAGAWMNAGTNTSITLSGLEPGTAYYWQVQAVNGDGDTQANNGAWWSFTTVSTQPGAFNKTAPADGSPAVGTHPTLSWEASSDAERYEYCYDTTDDDACSSWIDNGTAISTTLSSLDTATSYYWHVRAHNATGDTYSNGSETAFWSFNTNEPPMAFNKISPANEGSGWTGATDQGEPVSFHISADGKSWSNFRLQAKFTIGGCSGTDDYTFGGPGTITNGQFSDSFPAHDFTATLESETAASGTYRYVEATICGTTTLNGTWTASFPPRQSTSPTLAWESATGATSYEYCYDKTNDNTCAGEWTDAGTNNSVTPNMLDPNTTYYWQVRAVNTAGNTSANSGTWWSFTTVITPPQRYIYMPIIVK